ncbi:hypothetical protein BHE74_00034689 [Ensete ventricosum]|nr:hypothetical protein BHE74_00034689 [Ensete ventricosum]
MRLGTRLECVGSSSRVSGTCQDGTREFIEKRPRLTRRLLGVAKRLAGSWKDDGLRSSLGIGSSSDDTVGPRQAFAGRFAEGIGKLAETTPEDR